MAVFWGPVCAPGHLVYVCQCCQLVIWPCLSPLALGALPGPLALASILAFVMGSAQSEPPTSGFETAWPSAGASIPLPATAQLNTFRVALSFSPVPAGLALGVQGLRLVDMEEFLPDRLSLTHQLKDWVAPTDVLPSSHPSLREVSLVQSGSHVFCDVCSGAD